MTASRIHLMLAALMGAAGVALWAMAAHRAGGTNLVTAAQFLLLHASAVFGLTAARKQGLIHGRIASLAVSGLILGTILFAGDLTARVFLGHGLFPRAAPLGGILMIAGWLLAAAAALAPHEPR
jgi:uncharacterized membrane protein YgdD (TMEM256/DUF423 family)